MVEGTNPPGSEFGELRLADLIKKYEHLSADEFAERLLQDVLAWPGNAKSQADDITVVVVDVAQLR